MAPPEQVDAIVAGGGVAGCAAAAALARAGLSVLVVEPGQRAERRLSGELLHPLGARGLEALGFALPRRGTAPVRGFSVLHGRGGQSVLPYPEADGEGVAVDHGALRAELAAQLEARPGVALAARARIVGLDLADPDAPVALVRREEAVSRIRCRILVAADGAASRIRAMAGIGHRRRALSSLLGVIVDRSALPMPGYGHLFLGAPRPVFAYAVDHARARVMVDLPLGRDDRAGRALAEALAALPGALAAAVDRGGPGAGLSYASHEVRVETVARGPVVLVGDAAGSCHPLTATGMTMAVGDGLRLLDALTACPGRPRRALALYRRRRAAVQRTRHLLASALHETCSMTDPGAMLMRDGLERYWSGDGRGRAASMALLAMADVRLSAALREMACVAVHGVIAAGSARAAPDPRQPHMVLGVAGLIARQVQAALWHR